MENPWFRSQAKPDDSIDIRSSADRLDGEREERRVNARKRLKTGVPYLDKAMGGIRPNGLLLIGATSGAGKTELVSSIARTNAEEGKRVHFFALEAEPREIERRILYKLIAQEYFADKGENKPLIPMSYRDWYDYELDDLIEDYELRAQQRFAQNYQTLHTIYRNRDFTVDHLLRAIEQIEGKTDLIIIDHLNYFDYDESVSETQAVTRIMKTIRDIVLIHGVPVVLVAHLRKTDRRSKQIMPELEDFIGTSNVYKIPTEAVLISPAPMQDGVSFRFPTYMRVGKFRVEGGITRFVARCMFNAETNEYESIFQLGYWNSEEFESIDPLTHKHKLPRWAKPKVK